MEVWHVLVTFYRFPYGNAIVSKSTLFYVPVAGLMTFTLPRWQQCMVCQVANQRLHSQEEETKKMKREEKQPA